MTTVQQLIDQLMQIEDKSRIAILQKDSAGNGYSPLAGIDLGMYDAETPVQGEVWEHGSTPCLVLYPMK